MVGFSLFFGGIVALLAIAGLSMMEAGCSKSKNAGSIMMQAIMAVTVAIPCFLLVGDLVSGLSGSSAEMLEAMLAAMVCCIMAGGVVGRIRIEGYIVICALMSLVSYPLSVRVCILLDGAGVYQDFGFFGAACLSGAAAAYFASRILGVRAGKGTAGGASYAFPGHNIPFAMAGVMLLCMGLLGMAGSNGLLVGTGEQELEQAAENMVIGGAISGFVGLLFTCVRYKKPDITMTASAMAAGFVAALPGCSSVSLGCMCLIGAAAGFFTVIGIETLERGVKMDDPAGVVSIFGIGTIVGLLGAGIFNSQAGLKALPGNLAAIFIIVLINGLMVGVASQVSGSSRTGVGLLAILFLIGFFLFRKADRIGSAQTP